MKKQPLKILFVSHDASPTGAPNSLLNFLDYVRGHEVFDYRILLLRGGPLEGAFAERGPALVVKRDPRRHLLGRILHKLGLRSGQDHLPSWKEKVRLDAFLSGFSPDLIYLNSVAAAPTLGFLERWRVPVITYVRELSEYVQHTIKTGWFGELKARTSLFISVSEVSKRHLVENHGIPAERFAVINTFVDVAKLGGTPVPEARRLLRELIGRSEQDQIVVGCGTTDWRKGPDLFISVAKAFFLAQPESRAVFVWIGGMSSDTEKTCLGHDLRQAGLEERVIFVGAQAKSAILIAGADVLALTSREDPFPRVMLEAGIAGVPTVCFKNSGGGEEFIAKGTGFAVDYLDIAGFSKMLHKVLDDPALRAQIASQARETVQKEHNSLISSQRIISKIEHLVAENTPGR